MSRFIAVAVLAALVAGCADSAVAPQHHPSAPSFDAGTPPPPPVYGDGEGTFSAVSEGGDLGTTSAAPVTFCGSASSPLTYHFSYVTDNSSELGDNVIVHVK